MIVILNDKVSENINKNIQLTSMDNIIKEDNINLLQPDTDESIFNQEDFEFEE